MSDPSSAPTTAKSRVVFVDVLRLVATFQMVQGHTLDAVLAAELRVGPLFDVWQRLRGLTAVAFLFAAGLAFARTTLERWDDYRADPRRRRTRALRALRLIGLGYLLHLPVALLFEHAPAQRAAILADFLGVDVLHCIGVSLLVLEGLCLWLPTARCVALAATVLGAIALAASSITATIEPAGVWTPLLDYVSPRAGSIFPVLPWAGHLWLGVAIAYAARDAWWRKLLVVGLLLALVAGALLFTEPSAVTQLDHVVRLAGVVCLSAALAWVCAGMSRLPAWLERLSGSTLVVYVFHVLLVYGAGVGLAARIGPRLSLLPALGVTVAVMLASVAAVFAWDRRVTGLAAPARKR